MISGAGEVLDDLPYQSALGQVRMSVRGRSPDAQRNRLGVGEQLRLGNEDPKPGEQLLLGVDMRRDRRPETLATLGRRILLEIPEPLL